MRFSRFDCKAFKEMAINDFEFTRETRYLSGVIKLEFGGGEVWALNFHNGELISVENGMAVSDFDCKIVLGGRSDQWEELLAEKPKPFYQCFQSAAVKHDMRISDTNETFAYLPAVNRIITLLRKLRNKEA